MSLQLYIRRKTYLKKICKYRFKKISIYCLLVHFIPCSQSPWHQQKHYCLHPASFAQIHPVRWTPLEIRLHFSREFVSSFATAVWCFGSLFTYQSITHCIHFVSHTNTHVPDFRKGRVCCMSYTLKISEDTARLHINLCSAEQSLAIISLPKY